MDKASTTNGMEISAEKLMTKKPEDIRIFGQNLETVQSFKYLGFRYHGWRIKTGNSVQDCPNSWCIVKIQDHMERQEHCLQLQNQNDAFLGHSIFLYACETWTLTAD